MKTKRLNKLGIQPTEDPKQQNENLKAVIRATFNTYKWALLFLTIPTITHYIKPWPILQYTRDLGIIIALTLTTIIHNKMKKKHRESQKRKQEKKREGES